MYKTFFKPNRIIIKIIFSEYFFNIKNLHEKIFKRSWKQKVNMRIFWVYMLKVWYHQYENLLFLYFALDGPIFWSIQYERKSNKE